MMLGEQYQHDVDKALDTQQRLPITPPTPPTRFKNSVWAQPIRGLAAGIGDTLAGGIELAVGEYRALRAMDDPALRKQQQAGGVPFDGDNEFSRELRKVARGYRPDPATAGTAEQVVFELSRVIPKAVGYTLAAGPVGGAAALGTDEALTVADDLQSKGVDRDTRMKVAALSGVAMGAGVALPLAGSTVAKTLGLYALGGPGAFVAQQAATREILQDANYRELAVQYDPLDPTGLALSALIPLPFVALGIRANIKGAAPIAPTRPNPRAITPEQTDAVMTHNLSLQRDVFDAAAPARAVEPLPDAQPPAIADPGVPAPAKPLGEAEPAAAPPVKAEGEGGAPIADAMAEAVQPVAPLEPPVQALKAPDGDQHIQSALDRIAAVETEAPDMVVRMADDGTPVTLRDELARIRKEAAEGTDAELGAADANLLQVAADCALSLGA